MALTKHARTAGAAVAVALATAAVTGCDPATPSAAPPSASAVNQETAGVTTGTASATTAAPTATTTAAPSPSGCPDARTLEAALQANESLAKTILLGDGFVNIKCAGGFAIAEATPTNADAARVLFKFDPASSSWTALTVGTGFECTDYTSAAIARKLGC
jgi:hypothetical protein